MGRRVAPFIGVGAHSLIRLIPAAFFAFAAPIFAQANADSGVIEFGRDVRPILSERCFTCHGPDEASRQANFRLDVEDGAFRSLASGGLAIVRGAPGESKIIERITSENPAIRMPPVYAGLDALTESEIDVLRRWIEQGAPWARHWSFEPPTRPVLAETAASRWSRHPIDQLVYKRLQKDGLKPSSEASRETLIRRLSLDLTGLPPQPADVDSFAADETDGAYEKLVDRLLASPHYGERMAVDWLDAARYADTDGYQADGTRSMWRWRDWVVEAFNSNKPFDQFTIEQLAGDLLPNATLDQKIATAFNRNNRTTSEGGIVEEEFLVEYAADRAITTSTVWLGLTLGCARCHDHKYDPLQQEEFYQFFAFFNNLPERGLVHNFANDEPRIKAPTPAQEKKLQSLDAGVRDAEADLREIEPQVEAGVRAWVSELAHSTGKDWAIREGLVASYGFEKSKAPYVKWTETPEGWERGPSTLVLERQGKVGAAAELGADRTTDLGAVAGFDYTDPYSFSFWLRPDSENGAVMTRIHEEGEEQGWGFYLEDGKLRYEFTMRQTDLSMRLVSQRRLEIGRWQHLVLTYAGTLPSSEGTRMYLNGEPFPFDVEWDDLKWPIRYSQSLKLGTGGGKSSIEGAIDELRIYRRALSRLEAQVAALDRTLSQIAATAEADRTDVERAKVRRAYLDQRAPSDIRRSVAALTLAKQKRDLFFDSIPTVMVMKEREDVRPAHVLRRGAYDAPGEEVQPGAPASLPPLVSEGRATRLDLARWLVSGDNPLTARVIVNRYWQQLFGVGLVKTAEDFGSQGERPIDQELLDWLAVEFVESGWDVKAILKTIVMSRVYRQSSDADADRIAKDPENRLLARGPRFRLPAETIRDQALAASGLADLSVGGPPVKPYQPEGLWREVSGSAYQADSGDALYRRSLYTFWKRTVPPPSMATFDASDRESCNVQRARTNTPLQALTLMNDVTYVEASRKLAERMLMEGGPAAGDRLAYGYRRVLAREPSAAEAQTLLEVLNEFLRDYDGDRRSAKALLELGDSAVNKKLDPRTLAAYTNVASLILNLDEAVTKP